jgi:hypothetical protein
MLWTLQKLHALSLQNNTAIYATWISIFGGGQKHNVESFWLFCDEVQKAAYCSRITMETNEASARSQSLVEAAFRLSLETQ